MVFRKIIIGVAVVLLSLVYFTAETPVKQVLANSEVFLTKIKVFTSILETINRAYVDKTNPESLIEDAIHGVISNLDPHTVYLPADDFEAWNQDFEGYSGIGVSFDIVNNETTVLTVIDGGPGDRIGLQPGDKILEVNGQVIHGFKKEAVRKLVVGPVGTSLTLKVARDLWNAPKQLSLAREKIYVESIPFALILEPKVGYIKIERFTAQTGTELQEALQNLESKGMEYLILDLRGNGGGYLNSAIQVADKFIPGGLKLLTTKGQLPTAYQEYYATHANTCELYPLVVLIDHGSASASEIVAGAIQDQDRGLIVGKTSFGKGLVQSQYRFYDGSALLITTARYYTPSGRPIQRNYFNKSRHEYYYDAYDDSLLRYHKTQTNQPAYKTRTGRTVYAGGGITPDVWVDNEQNILSQQLRELYFSDERFFYSYAEKYLQVHPRIKFHQPDFIHNFVVSEATCDDFLHFIRMRNSELTKSNFRNDRENIKFLLKREIALILWGKEAQFRVNLHRDHQLLEAIDQISQARTLLVNASF